MRASTATSQPAHRIQDRPKRLVWLIQLIGLSPLMHIDAGCPSKPDWPIGFEVLTATITVATTMAIAMPPYAKLCEYMRRALKRNTRRTARSAPTVCTLLALARLAYAERYHPYPCPNATLYLPSVRNSDQTSSSSGGQRIAAGMVFLRSPSLSNALDPIS